MPTTLDHFSDYILEQLAAMRGVHAGRFFGGIGFKQDDVQFGMVIAGALYFVVDDTTRPNYESMGSRCFSYATRKRSVDVRRYYSVPANVIEDEEELTRLAREAVRVAAMIASRRKQIAASKSRKKRPAVRSAKKKAK